jgi:hypothetical protein
MKLPFVLRDRNAQANFDRLLAALDFEKLKIGSGSVVFTAAVDSSNVLVSHGLGGTPKGVWVQFHDTGSLTATPAPNVFSASATTFNLIGHNATAITGTIPFYWLAIR